MQPQDEESVQPYVEDGAGGYADKPNMGIALQAQLVVECEGGHHEGRGNENIEEILAGIRHYGGRGTQQRDQLWQVCYAENSGENTYNHRREESHTGHMGGVVVVLASQSPTDVIAGAVSEKESHGLYE